MAWVPSDLMRQSSCSHLRLEDLRTGLDCAIDPGVRPFEDPAALLKVQLVACSISMFGHLKRRCISEDSIWFGGEEWLLNRQFLRYIIHVPLNLYRLHCPLLYW